MKFPKLKNQFVNLNIKLVFSVVILATYLMLSGCDKPPSYQEFMENPELVKKKYDQCIQMKETNSTSKICENIIKAHGDISVLLDQAIREPQKFGQNILELQSKLSALTKEKTEWASNVSNLEEAKKLETDKEKSLRTKEAQIKEYQFLIQQRFAVLRMLSDIK